MNGPQARGCPSAPQNEWTVRPVEIARIRPIYPF